MKLPLSLTRVTPLSKALAILLFIALPILGVYSGMAYQKRLDNITGMTPSGLVSPTGSSSPSATCGLESCHGLNVACGPHVPTACDLMYQFGDRCRQYIACQVVSGSCQTVKSPLFDKCKTCVERCQKDFPNDPVNGSACESKC